MSGRIFCELCAKPFPPGCFRVYGEQEGCPHGKQTQPECTVGMALWNDLIDRRGVKHELLRCDPDVQAEIIQTLGRIAIEAVRKLPGTSEGVA